MILIRTNKSSSSKYSFSGIIIGLIISGIAVGTYHQSGNARVCSSCHSMKLVHNRWLASNHRQFSCMECHLPDTHIAGKVTYKIRAGFHDLTQETMRNYGAGIGLSAAGRQIVNKNCFRCHASTIVGTPMALERTNCLNCHRYLVHGRGADEGGIKVE